MKYFALMDGNVVHGTATSNDDDGEVNPVYREVTEERYLDIISYPIYGGTLNEEGTTYDGPDLPPEVLLVPVGSFYDLFTYEQRATVFDLADGTVQAPNPEDNRRVRDLVQRINTGQPINLKSPRVLLGLQLLASLGIFGVDPGTIAAEIERILNGVAAPGAPPE